MFFFNPLHGLDKTVFVYREISWSLQRSLSLGFFKVQQLIKYILHASQLGDFIELYPPEDQNEVDLYNEALALATRNKEWNDVNEQTFFDWLTENTPASVPRMRQGVQPLNGHSFRFWKASNPVNPMY